MVELPALNEDQRIFLFTIFNYFHTEGTWPTFLWVENTIRKMYPERWPHFDIAEVSKSLPDNFSTGFNFNHQYGQEAAFIAPVLYYFPEAKEEITDFIRALSLCVEKINASDEERPPISSNDLTSQLHMQPLAVRKMGLLLQSEVDIADGSGANKEWWQVGLKRGKNGVRCFEGVETFEQYLEKRTALTRYFSGTVVEQIIQNEPVNDTLPADLGMVLSNTQYAILQRDQRSISGVVKPSLDGLKTFFCYAHEDEILLEKLKSHLRPLEQEGFIHMWHDRDIRPGEDWKKEINRYLNEAQIILLLVSSDFLSSDYCSGIEMQRAIERHNEKEATVIPIILRPVYWKGGILGKLQALPTNAKPITSWRDPDEAFLDVVNGIRGVVEQLISQQALPIQSTSLKESTLDLVKDKNQITTTGGDRKSERRNVLYQLFFAELLERLRNASPGSTNAKKT